jgi:hypothetical protein
MIDADALGRPAPADGPLFDHESTAPAIPAPPPPREPTRRRPSDPKMTPARGRGPASAWSEPGIVQKRAESGRACRPAIVPAAIARRANRARRAVTGRPGGGASTSRKQPGVSAEPPTSASNDTTMTAAIRTGARRPHAAASPGTDGARGETRRRSCPPPCSGPSEVVAARCLSSSAQCACPSASLVR